MVGPFKILPNECYYQIFDCDVLKHLVGITVLVVKTLESLHGKSLPYATFKPNLMLLLKDFIQDPIGFIV